MKKTLYDNLHVPSNASPELIELAYQVRKKMLEDATDDEAQDELKLMQQSYEILSDRQQRASYDQSLDPKTSNYVSAIHDSDEKAEENNHSGTIKWLALAAIAIACFLAYQHFIRENKKTGASIQETSALGKNPNSASNVPDDRVAPAAVAGQPADPQPQVSVQAQDIKNALAGSWTWKSDKITFGRDDRGTYYRDNAVCFEFSYVVKGDVLTETADKPHACGSGLTSSFHISIARNSLTKKHTVTPYESQWEKSPE